MKDQTSSGVVTSLAALGEFGLIRRYTPTHLHRAAEVVRGVGDDCAVLRGEGGQDWLVTKDLLLEGVHFRRDWCSAEAIGHKALAVNLSDVAAMGGEPRFVFLGVGVPPGLGVEWLDGFMRGFRALADLFRVDLLGGDTVASPDRLYLSVTVLGRVAAEHARFRGGARPGDALLVTGWPGEARRALELRLAGEACPEALARALDWPQPRVAEGQALGCAPAVGALMDLSDGLLGDLGHVLEASRVGARLVTERLPVSPALLEACGGDRSRAAACVLGGGDDYELLFSQAPGTSLPAFAGGLPVTVVGEVVAAPGLTLVHPDGREEAVNPRGFDHF
jgi:thiamine-monophosphate kinase